MNFLRLFFFATFAFAIHIASPTVDMPVLHTSTDLANYVKKSLMQDLETINLLDREMATPIKKTRKVNRKLRKRQQVDPTQLAKQSQNQHRPVHQRFAKLNSRKTLSRSLEEVEDESPEDSEFAKKSMTFISDTLNTGRSNGELRSQH